MRRVCKWTRWRRVSTRFEDCILVTTKTLVSCRFWFQLLVEPRNFLLAGISTFVSYKTLASLRDTDYFVDACIKHSLMTVILLALSCKCAFSEAIHEAAGSCNRNERMTGK